MPKLPRGIRPILNLLLVVLLAGALYGWHTAAREASTLRASLQTSRTIVRAIDGDTLELDGKERVRLLGVDTPEVGRFEGGKWVPFEHPDPRAVAASEYMRSLEGRKVTLAYDKTTRDRYGRTLAHVYLLPDGPDLACEMLRRGLGDVCAIKPNTARYGLWKRVAEEGKISPAPTACVR